MNINMHQLRHVYTTPPITEVQILKSRKYFTMSMQMRERYRTTLMPVDCWNTRSIRSYSAHSPPATGTGALNRDFEYAAFWWFDPKYCNCVGSLEMKTNDFFLQMKCICGIVQNINEFDNIN